MQVSRQASRTEVKRAYHRAALQVHPDQLSALPEEQRHHAEEQFKTLNEAYHFLLNRLPPDARKQPLSDSSQGTDRADSTLSDRKSATAYGTFVATEQPPLYRTRFTIARIGLLIFGIPIVIHFFRVSSLAFGMMVLLAVIFTYLIFRFFEKL